MTDWVAPHIKSLPVYVPGKPIEEVEAEFGIPEAVKLASNENPLGPSPKALAALEKAMAQVHRYPDGGSVYLRRRLAEIHGVAAEQILVGNGSNEILDLIAKTFLRPGEEGIYAEQAFVVYPMSVQSLGAVKVSVPLKNFCHDLEAMADRITQKTRILFIANPNNPTGTSVGAREMERFLTRVPPRVLVVCDEAYFEYVERPDFPRSLEYLAQGHNLFVLRTFSKIYGLAGLRVGYMIGKQELVNYVNQVREPFNVNSLAQAAALGALDDREHVTRTREVNAKGKKFLYALFQELGLSFVPTEANFVLVRVDREEEIYEGLLREGVIVRPMIGWGLPGYLRVSIGLPSENERFAHALRKVWKEN